MALHLLLWESLQFIELTEIVRQKNECCFAAVLNRVRLNQLTVESTEGTDLNRRDRGNELNGTEIHTWAENVCVDEYNSRSRNTAVQRNYLSVNRSCTFRSFCQQTEDGFATSSKSYCQSRNHSPIEGGRKGHAHKKRER